MPCRNRLRPPVPEGRRDITLSYAEENRHDATRYVAEPVPSFSYISSALVVLACFRDGAITHIADGRKGMSAGTGLARLNMTELQRLERSLPFEELVGLVPAKFRAPLRPILGDGGLLPPKTFAAVADALTASDPGLATRLARFSENRARALRGLTSKERENLGVRIRGRWSRSALRCRTAVRVRCRRACNLLLREARFVLRTAMRRRREK